ncbi:MAG: PGDYG domain-containing protein [Candidatus Thermoplasmatota archaeon]|nr:PGDYG domain-containing protein [Candidatus Thermoplasmatota archaeon]
MGRYRKKPVVIEAVQITRSMTVETLEGMMNGSPGDWLITGIAGEQYFCKDEIFRQTYDLVED